MLTRVEREAQRLQREDEQKRIERDHGKGLRKLTSEDIKFIKALGREYKDALKTMNRTSPQAVAPKFDVTDRHIRNIYSEED